MLIGGREVSIYELRHGGRWWWDRRYITEAEQIAAMPPLPEALLAEIEAALSRRFCDSVLSWSSTRLDQGQNEGVTMYSYAIEAPIRFTLVDELHALLSIENVTIPGITITVLHESVDDADSYDLPNRACTPHIAVADGESLVLLARESGRMIGSAVFEVDCSAADFGYCLRPVSLCNMLCDQVAVSDVRELHTVDEVEVSAC